MPNTMHLPDSAWLNESEYERDLCVRRNPWIVHLSPIPTMIFYSPIWNIRSKVVKRSVSDSEHSTFLSRCTMNNIILTWSSTALAVQYLCTTKMSFNACSLLLALCLSACACFCITFFVLFFSEWTGKMARHQVWHRKKSELCNVINHHRLCFARSSIVLDQRRRQWRWYSLGGKISYSHFNFGVFIMLLGKCITVAGVVVVIIFIPR